ncbi:hypothetical protein KY290_008014 [Solanum tuberosum]|uniref:Uncharacterized protein n=1 Tax=Solanum tuberosum TaxID=4113 RepID=A0ABQ7W773_SOLTU|nr:hypothetical protein KY290_008014 [Solanum tuberosum]
MEVTMRSEHIVRYFKFLHCWTEHEQFFETVKQYWDREVKGTPMWRFHHKLKRVASTLSSWSRKEFGDIFATVREYDEKVRIMEEEVINNNTEANRTKLHQTNANYIRYMKLESSILRQKTQLQCFKDGDTNSKYFHAIMRGRRKKLFIHKLCTGNDDWIQGDENIAKEAGEYFQHIFTGQEIRINEDILQHTFPGWLQMSTIMFYKLCHPMN